MPEGSPCQHELEVFCHKRRGWTCSRCGTFVSHFDIMMNKKPQPKYTIDDLIFIVRVQKAIQKVHDLPSWYGIREFIRSTKSKKWKSLRDRV